MVAARLSLTAEAELYNETHSKPYFYGLVYGTEVYFLMLVQLFSQAIMRINFHLKVILSNTFTQTHDTKILFVE
jgi:hypothetical protein